MRMMMNVCGFDWQARYRLSNHANSVEFPPDCNHSDLILLPLVKNAVMTMVSTPLPCTAVRDGDPDHVPLACHRGVCSEILFHSCLMA